LIIDGVSGIAAVGAILAGVKTRKTLDTMSIPELVAFYQRGFGADDDAGRVLKARGEPARSELIRLLDATPAAELDGDRVATIVKILTYEFPSQPSSEAVERLRSRLTGSPRLRDEFRSRSAIIRAQASGRWNEAWEKEQEAMSPAEKNLHYTELLLEYCVPSDRVSFLVEVARQTLDLGQEAKAEAYAREILATPDLVARSGDGVYYGNHVLGMLALRQGDIAGAKQYLIASSKTPGSWEMNGIRPPDPSLAMALLARGEREAVCEYLDGCKVFSKKDAMIERWKRTIRAG
jgi:hypothetical protein